MHSKGRRISVCREDVLTKRGANPRTGIISPYILSGNPEVTGAKDYVQVGWVRNELKSTEAVNERWRQDDYGWSLVERAGGLSRGDIDRKQIHAPDARAQATSEGQSLKGLVKTHENTDHSVLDYARQQSLWKNTGLFMDGTGSSLVDRKVPPHSLFRIPRKAVGSSECTFKVRSGNGQNTLSKDKTSASFPLTCLYPPQPSRTQSPKNPVRQGRHKYDNFGAREPGITLQGLNSSIQYTSSDTSHSSHVNSVLETTTYRRSPELLPVRFRAPSTLDSNYNRSKRDVNPLTNCQAMEQRPQIKRVIATTSVPTTRLIKEMDKSPINQTEVHPTSYKAGAASSPCQGVIWGKVDPTLNAVILDASTCTARKALRLTCSQKLHEEMTKKVPLEDVPMRGLPPLNLDSVYKAKQTVSPDARAPEKQSNVCCNRIRSNDSFRNAVETDLTEWTRRDSSKSDNKALSALFLVAIKELLSLIDYGRIHRQLYNVIKHALQTLHQAPWAIQTLKSQTAEVLDYILAIRLMLMSTLYLAMLFSVLAATLKVLNLMADIGRCLWYPMDLLMATIQWISVQ